MVNLSLHSSHIKSFLQNTNQKMIRETFKTTHLTGKATGFKWLYGLTDWRTTVHISLLSLVCSTMCFLPSLRHSHAYHSAQGEPFICCRVLCGCLFKPVRKSLNWEENINITHDSPENDNGDLFTVAKRGIGGGQ